MKIQQQYNKIEIDTKEIVENINNDLKLIKLVGVVK